MHKFAVIDNNVVVNIIVADSLEIAENATNKTCVEYQDSDPVLIGWFWDGTNFVKPTLEEPIA